MKFWFGVSRYFCAMVSHGFVITITTIATPMGYQSDTYFIATIAPIPQTEHGTI